MNKMTAFMKAQPGRMRYVVIIIALVMLVASCSFKTFYNQLDYLLPAYVEGMVSLDGLLEEKVEQRTLVLLGWHRNTQLNQYADFLRELQRDINQQLTEEKVLLHISTLESFWKSILLKVNEEMAILLPLLNTEQQQELFESIADNNEDFYEDRVAIDSDERIDQYAERMLDNYEKWLGDLTDEQEVAVEQAAAELVSSAELRLQRRQQWQRAIQEVLGKSESPAQKSDYLREFFAGFHKQTNTEMKNAEETNKLVLARLTVQIVHSMTEKQKTHFTSETNDYIRMFNELAEEH